MNIPDDDTERNDITDVSARETVPKSVGSNLSYRDAKRARYRAEITKRQTTGTIISLLKFFKSEIKAIRSTDVEARRKSTRDIATFIQYYDGNVNGRINAAGEWESDEINSGDLTYTIPLTAPHVDSGKTLLLKTLTEYEYQAINKDSVLDQSLARMCQELGEEEIGRILTDDKSIREILYILTCGKTYRRHFWATDALNPNTIQVSSYEDKEVELAAKKVCAACGTPADDETVICPRCQSTEFLSSGGGVMMQQELVEKEVELAENQLHIPHPLSVQHELSAIDIDYSGFVVERDAISRKKGEYLYQQVIPHGNSTLSDETRVIRNLERDVIKSSNENATFNDAIGELTQTDQDEIERESVWLAPHRYASRIIGEEGWYLDEIEGLIKCDDCQPPENAVPVPADAFLIDVMPSGIFLTELDETITEIHPDTIPDKWIKIIFGMRPSHTDGAGLQRIKPLQDMENDRINLEFKILMEDAAPTTFLNRKYIQRLAQVGEYSIVDDLEENHSWENVVHRLQGATSHPALGNMGERNQGLMQYIAGTFSTFGGGASDIRAAGTATGVAAMAEEVAGRFLEAIKLRKEADIKSRFIVLKNIQKRSIQPQKDALIERFGQDVCDKFFSCSLRHTISIRAKKGTDQPQSQALKIASLQVLGNLQAAVKDSPQAQDILSYASEEMNLPLNIGIGLTFKREAEYRIAKVKEATKQFSGFQFTEMPPEAVTEAAMQIFAEVLREVERGSEVGNIAIKAAEAQAAEAALAAQTIPEGAPMPPPPEMPIAPVVMTQDHNVFMETYADFLMSEQARGANSVFRAVIFLNYQLHYDRDLMKKSEQAKQMQKMKQQLAPPMPAGPSPEDMKAEQEEAEQKQVAMEIAGRKADEESKDLQLARDEQSKDRQLERDLAKNEHQHGLNKEANKDKPKAAEKN